MRYRRQSYPGQTYFFTVVTAGRRPVFADPAMVDRLRRVTAEVKARFPFGIDGAVILPDHVHSLWHMPEDDGNHSLRWWRIKELFSRRCGLPPVLGTRGRGIWQPRYWEHRIRDDADFERHLAYIHWNPVKHGLVSDAIDWPWSSIHHHDYAASPEAQEHLQAIARSARE